MALHIAAKCYLCNPKPDITDMKTMRKASSSLRARRVLYGADAKSLLRLGWPVLITQLGIIVVSFADTMMVGAYGTNELAAAAFVNNLFMVPAVMMIGFAGGVTPLVGALFGKGDAHGIGRTVRVSVQLNALLAFALMAIMGALYFFLDRMGQDPDLLPLIRPYYLITLAALLPMAIFNCCQQTANGVTDTAMPMWVILGANALNIVGNYALIFGHFGMPELGLKGAGLSTLTARTLACLLIAAIVLLHKRYRPYRSGMFCAKSCGALRRKVWSTSYPVMIQSGVECSLWSMGAVVSGWFGKISLAGYQVITTISQLGFMVYLSFGTATSIKVANYAGTDDVEGVRRAAGAGMFINIAMGTLASIVFVSATHPLLALFTPDEDVISSAQRLIVPLVLYQYLDAIQITYANAQRGTSRVKPLLWVSLISYIGVGMPLIFSLGVWAELGSRGVYFSFCGALLGAAVLLRWWFIRTLRAMRAAEATK